MVVITNSKVSSQQSNDNQKQWKFFKMYFDLDKIKTKDISIVNQLRVDLEMLDNPKFQKKFQLVVDIRPKNDSDKYVVYGDYNSTDLMKDYTAYRDMWIFLASEVRDWLINYKGKNKINNEEN